MQAAAQAAFDKAKEAFNKSQVAAGAAPIHEPGAGTAEDCTGERTAALANTSNTPAGRLARRSALAAAGTASVLAGAAAKKGGQGAPPEDEQVDWATLEDGDVEDEKPATESGGR